MGGAVMQVRLVAPVAHRGPETGQRMFTHYPNERDDGSDPLNPGERLRGCNLSAPRLNGRIVTLRIAR
jgi:hypothetical protein